MSLKASWELFLGITPRRLHLKTTCRRNDMAKFQQIYIYIFWRVWATLVGDSQSAVLLLLSVKGNLSCSLQ